MYRNKSAVSLRTLAHSLKQSITMDRSKAQRREFRPLRSSASTIELVGRGNQYNNNARGERKNYGEEYLMMLETRKSSKLGQKNAQVRQSNRSEARYDVRATKQLIMQRKEKLMQMACTEQVRRLPVAQTRTALPEPSAYSSGLTCTLGILQEQQFRLKRVIEQNFSSTDLKASNRHLTESQALSKELKQISAKHRQFLQHQQQLQNRLSFLEEQILATEMNFIDQLNEKENCECFLEQYKNEGQFREEAQKVMRLIEVRYETEHGVERGIVQGEKRLLGLEAEFKQWKLQQNIELKQKRFQNKLKQHRIELMQIQNQLDCLTDNLTSQISPQSAQQNGVRKIRQYICSYFKRYNQLNLNHIFHNQIDDGMDVFLCKEGLIGEFERFVGEKTEKVCLVDGGYAGKLKEYCGCLKRIEGLFHVQKTEMNRVVAVKFEEQIISVKKELQTLKLQKEKNLTQIQSLQQDIDKILAQDNLSVIQLMSKKGSSQFSTNKQDGFFNINEIKARIKQIKAEQVRRINQVSQTFLRLKQLSQRQAKFMRENKANLEKFAKEKQFLIKEIEVWKKKVEEIAVIKQGYESKKAKCDKLIDEAVTRMKEKDEAQVRLKCVEKEIEKLKKQKLQSITMKHQAKRRNEEFVNFQETKSLIRPSSSVAVLGKSLKSPWGRKLDSCKPQYKLKLETHKIAQLQTESQEDENASAEFRVTKDLKATNYQRSGIDEDKMSTKTQSSPKNVNQRLSLRALNSILLSKCNLVDLRNVVKGGNLVKNLAESVGLSRTNKENEKRSDELCLQSRQNSIKNLKQVKVEKKASLAKNTQRSTLRENDSSRNTATKLSLSTTNRKTSMKKILGQAKYVDQTKDSRAKISVKDMNSLITKKLLRQ